MPTNTNTTDSDTEPPIDLFADPPDYYPRTPPPTTQTYTLASGATITLHLVGYSPGEAHHLWNGARSVSAYFERSPEIVRGRTVLELGAGAGLPSLVAGVLGARRVVATDLVGDGVVERLRGNVRGCVEGGLFAGGEGGDNGDGKGEGVVLAHGFTWGGDVSPLLALLPPASSGRRKGFDVLILADLLFRHSEHGRLAQTIRDTMARRRDAGAYVFFTSYRPWLREKDLGFFDVVRAAGLEVEQVADERTERPLFEDDPGDEEVRKTVSGFVVRWPMGMCEDGDGGSGA